MPKGFIVCQENACESVVVDVPGMIKWLKMKVKAKHREAEQYIELDDQVASECCIAEAGAFMLVLEKLLIRK